MTSQQHDIDAICTKNVNVRPRRCRFERIGLRDSRRRTAAQMEKRKLKKLNGLGNEDENTKIYWCSRVSTRSCRRNSSRMVTTTMSDIVEDNCNLIIPYTESPYRMSTESKHMTGSLRATEDTSNKSGRLENPDVTRAAKLDELNQCDRRRATDSTLTTFEHCCSSNKSSNTNNNRINKQCVCVTTTPNASAFISSKRSAEVVGVGSGNRQHQQQHCRTTTLPQASQYVFRPQLSLPLRLSNVANGTVDEELAGAVGCGGSTRFCSQKTRNKSRVCDEQRTLSTSLTASDGGGDQLASTADATAIVRTSGGDYVPDFGTLTDGLILPETNASRDVKIFKRVLRDPKLRQPFQAFLEQQFCAENLNFYVAVERFRDMQFNNENKASERANFARHIYERHFATNSTEPVNVDNSTSKRIRETMEAGKYPRNTFDLAQYQIFHLLKYDCWPRFLRAGGVQPEFSDEELAEEDERQHRLDIGEDLPESHSTRSANEGDRQPSTSTSTLCAITDRKKVGEEFGMNHLVVLDCSDVGSLLYGHGPLCDARVFQYSEKDKLRSLLWHGFDRFSRRLRRESVTSRLTEGSPLSRPCLFYQHKDIPWARSSSTETDEQTPQRSYSSEESGLTTAASGSLQREAVIGFVGLKRRSLFATTGKQHPIPAEVGRIAIHM
ncbi:hypothetical protein KIN20_032593 [Parelaphostrongylus tenuis]|uniref:RGS domain-containing protein n=1 Tax=Parelaphostrongylus tenuis TaxID=148309 RepID=A0AAD5WHL6_PARTN|nr:hypothetical protein KIN20_032593 [Parelaphostrongylus tenuis]